MPRLLAVVAAILHPSAPGWSDGTFGPVPLALVTRALLAAAPAAAPSPLRAEGAA